MDEKLREVLFDIRDSLKNIEGFLYYHYHKTTDTTPLCTCRQYTPGSLTGGWFCPLHGQIF